MYILLSYDVNWVRPAVTYLIVYCVKNSLPTSSDFYMRASLTKYIPLDGSLHVSRGMSFAEEMTSGGGEGTLTSAVAPSIF